MIIDSPPQVQPSSSLKPIDHQTKSADKVGNMLPPANHAFDVDISDEGHLALERERKNIADARDNQAFVDFRGRDGQLRLGLMALGKAAINGWSDKGLEVTDESILAAADAFQEAFRQSLEEHGSATAGAAIALNRHQVVINSQAVPGWFIEEYQNTLSSMGESGLKNSFAAGNRFFVSHPSVSVVEALRRYANVNDGA